MCWTSSHLDATAMVVNSISLYGLKSIEPSANLGIMSCNFWEDVTILYFNLPLLANLWSGLIDQTQLSFTAGSWVQIWIFIHKDQMNHC